MIAYLVVTGIEDGYVFPHLFSTEEKANAFAEKRSCYPGYPCDVEIGKRGLWVYFYGSVDGYADVETFKSAAAAERHANSRRDEESDGDYEEGIIHLTLDSIDADDEE